MIFMLLFFFSFLHSVSTQVISIDYGSSSYKISIVKVGTPMEIVLNSESKRYTPPCVGFKDSGRYVGSTAENIWRKTPAAATCDFHMVLGRNYSNPIVSKYISETSKMEIKSDEARAGPVFYPAGSDMNFVAEDFLAQLINESSTVSGGVKTIVIAMPPMIDHSTRNSLKIAAKIVKVNLIGIVDSSTAATYQYLINRKTDILSGNSPSVVLILDVGASKTTATIIKVYPDSASSGSKHARGDVIGIGFVSYGGNHITKCIFDMLVERLKTGFQSHTEILKNHRKKLALLSEAERIKIIFSTAPEASFHMESFFEEKDFSGKVKREEFEKKCTDTFYKITSSIEKGLISANLTKDDLKSVVLLGKASRTYSLQSIIKEVSGKDKLSQVLNTEDSVAHGSAFKGAEISKQFKVAKISVHHSVVYPIEVLYEKEELDEQTEKTSIKQYKKVVYSHMSDATQRRTVTIHNVTSNITLRVQYGDIPEIYSESSFLNQDKELMDVKIYGLEDAIRSNPKGILQAIKVTFALNHFGMIQVIKAEAKFERILEKSTFTKMFDSISNAFGFGSNSTDEKNPAAEAAENKTTEAPDNENQNEAVDNSTINTADGNSTDTIINGTATKNTTSKPKIPRFQETISLKMTVAELFFTALPDEQISLSYMKLKKIQMREMKKAAESKAKSDLEAYIYDMRDRLEEGKDIHSVLNSSELQNATSTLDQVSTWFEENGYDAGYDENTEKHKLLTDAVFIAESRLKEKRDLENELANFYRIANMSLSMVNESTKFPGAMDVLNATYLANLTDMILETLKNVREMHEKQNEMKPYETPALLSSTVKAFSSIIHSSVDEMISEVRKASYKKKASESTKSGKGNSTKTSGAGNQTVDDETIDRNSTEHKFAEAETKSVETAEERFEEKIESETSPEDDTSIPVDESDQISDDEKLPDEL